VHGKKSSASRLHCSLSFRQSTTQLLKRKAAHHQKTQMLKAGQMRDVMLALLGFRPNKLPPLKAKASTSGSYNARTRRSEICDVFRWSMCVNGRLASLSLLTY
jgi:hypothetical protein